MITARDKYDCARREVALRRRVYIRMMAEGNMKAGQAEWQIEVMEAIAADYRAQVEREEERLI